MHPAPPRLGAHLGAWLGSWPPRRPLRVIGAAQRELPGWDGRTHPALGVASPHDGALLSVPPRHTGDVRRLAATGDLPAVLARLPAQLGEPGRGTFTAAFRWTLTPTPLPEAGSWHDADGPDIPQWLRPFGGQVLLALDDNGRYLAGVGSRSTTGTATSSPSSPNPPPAAAAWPGGWSRRPPAASWITGRSRPTCTTRRTPPQRASRRPRASPARAGPRSACARRRQTAQGAAPTRTRQRTRVSATTNARTHPADLHPTSGTDRRYEAGGTRRTDLA